MDFEEGEDETQEEMEMDVKGGKGTRSREIRKVEESPWWRTDDDDYRRTQEETEGKETSTTRDTSQEKD